MILQPAAKLSQLMTMAWTTICIWRNKSNSMWENISCAGCNALLCSAGQLTQLQLLQLLQIQGDLQRNRL